MKRIIYLVIAIFFAIIGLWIVKLGHDKWKYKNEPFCVTYKIRVIAERDFLLSVSYKDSTGYRECRVSDKEWSVDVCLRGDDISSLSASFLYSEPPTSEERLFAIEQGKQLDPRIVCEIIYKDKFISRYDDDLVHLNLLKWEAENDKYPVVKKTLTR